jgi:hypothetical protein
VLVIDSGNDTVIDNISAEKKLANNQKILKHAVWKRFHNIVNLTVRIKHSHI